MLEQGRKSDAIRMYREQTGADRLAAAAAVEALNRVETVLPASMCASRASREANLKADLWALVQHGQKREAIQLYCLRTGEPIRRARDAIDALADEHGVAPGRTGCFGLLLCFAVPAVLALLMAG